MKGRKWYGVAQAFQWEGGQVGADIWPGAIKEQIRQFEKAGSATLIFFPWRPNVMKTALRH